MKIALFLIGYGNVAQRFVQLLDESKPYLEGLGIEPTVAAVITRHHGRVVNLPAGATHATITDAISRDVTVEPEPLRFLAATLDDPQAQKFPVRVLVETSTLDIRAGEPATSHVRAALSRGIHVITANKGPVAFAYRQLAAEAAETCASFLFEGAVMDGIPIFNLVRETMPGVTIRSFRGVVNTTTNYLLAAMERGEPFDAALGRMQAAGVAEADPSPWPGRVSGTGRWPSDRSVDATSSQADPSSHRPAMSRTSMISSPSLRGLVTAVDISR